MFDFYLHGKSAADYGVYVTERPSIPAPQKRITQQQVPGKNSVITIDENTFEAITISINCNFMVEDENNFHNEFRKIKSWLLSEMQTVLSFSDDIDCFYKVQSIAISNVERTSKRIGVFAVNCICEPFQYLVSGKKEISFEPFSYDGNDKIEASFDSILINDYYLAQPIYKFQGEGIYKLYVNDKYFEINVAQNCVVDTSLGIIYRENGELINQTAKGNFEDLWLRSGENIFAINYPIDAEKPTIIPNWRSL